MIRLQLFGHRVSGYERPQEPWICGWAAIGQPCRVGPDRRGRCQATFECQPQRQGDRWQCTRPPTAGGRCPEGPRPDGACNHPIPRCVPVRNQRSRRGQTAGLSFAILLGLLALVLGGTQAAWLVEPGPLSSQHAGIQQCSSCHTGYAAGPIGWLHAAFASALVRAAAQPCLACHDIGKHPLAAHGLDAAALTKLGRTLVSGGAAARHAGAAQAAPIEAAAFALPEVARRDIPCSACHREHRGAGAQLTSVGNAICQTCHAVRFASLANGHPDFRGFPFRRRMRIIFDHAKHFDQHFERADKAFVPAGCTGCHALGPAGEAMLVKPFAATCGGCHLDQIRGKEAVGDKGIAVLGVPGLDLTTLQGHDAAIGDWPAEADADLSPFLRFLLSRRPETATDLAALGTASLDDLSHASDRQIAAAARIAWTIKELLFDLSIKGPGLVAQAAAGHGGSPDEATALIGGLPPDAIKTAEKLWFPNLADEVARHRAGERVPMKAPKAARSSAAAPPPAAPGGQGAIAGTGGGAILGGGILGGAPSPPAAAAAPPPAPEKPPPPEPMGNEAWTGIGGGWYRQDYYLYYRPVEHADRFLQAWLDVIGRQARDPNGPARALFARLSDPTAPGACGKCHSIDRGADGVRIVNWFPFRPDRERHDFTRFAHRPHLSLFGSAGCKTCHQLAAAANFAASYKRGDPFGFAAAFKPIERQLCAPCHVAGRASASCATCHNYHIGHIQQARGVPALGTPQQRSQAGEGSRFAARLP